jgi:uncharacterized protein
VFKGEPHPKIGGKAERCDDLCRATSSRADDGSPGTARRYSACAYLDGLAADDTPIISSILLETELRRLAVRHELSQALVSDVLLRFDLLEPDRAIFIEAGLLPGTHLRTLDALHIATALRAEADAMVAYDLQQSDAARAFGLHVVTPE